MKLGAVRGEAVDDPGSSLLIVQGGAANVKELLEKVKAGERWLGFDEYRPFRARDWFPRWRRGLVSRENPARMARVVARVPLLRCAGVVQH